jgi:hypothetical protein
LIAARSDYRFNWNKALLLTLQSFESTWGHYYIRVFASPSLLSGSDEIAGHPYFIVRLRNLP